jgi:hypothetical protein
MLICSIIVTAMFGVALTTKTNSGKTDRRMLATQAAAQLTSMLKGYVTGCGCDSVSGVCSAANGDCTLILGPNRTQAGALTWSLNGPVGDTRGYNGARIIDSLGDVYALMNGEHSISGLLPAWFESAPYNARVVYTVSSPTTISGRPVPQVSVDVRWSE